MILHRWNHRSRKYEDYEVPDNWSVAVTAPTIDTFVDCAGCGKSIPFGAAFTSAEIHTVSGFGFAVCNRCYCAESGRKQSRERYQAKTARQEREENKWSGATMASIKRWDGFIAKVRAAHGLPPLGGSNDGKA